ALKRKLFYRGGPTEGPVAGELEFPHDLSLNAALNDDGATHMDMLPDTEADPMEAVAGVQERALVKREVTGALALLNDRERMVVEKRVMSDEPESLQKIGAELGITRERVRQIESSALKKLQKSLSGMVDGPGGVPEPA
ncbi:MAG: sigma factor-like helix-turn-helix DNA-binding protein, partial [Deltaproteobacteria bacterium]|nr:sigma factor-like helix-turn-helix DNA-binding protein [Deltaproteobacteria bacterium]